MTDSATLEKVRELIQQNKLRVSDHAYDELVDDGLLAREVIDGVNAAVVVEDYPFYAKGPCARVAEGFGRIADPRALGNPFWCHGAGGYDHML